jgi:hypothetical protein
MLIEMDMIQREYFLIELIRGGCSLRNGCRLVGMTVHQGRYILKKRQTSVKQLKQYHRMRNVTSNTLDAAHRLLAAGATGEEVAMITGITVNQICHLDRKYGYWLEGMEHVIA